MPCSIMMIRHIPHQTFGTVELFKQYHAGQFVRERLGAEGYEVPRLGAYRFMQAEGAAHDEAGAARSIGGQSIQKAGKFA